MRILALIPARGGSKRVPRKNIRLLGGKPLITWSIEAAHGVSGICDILVSTDDQEIAKVARNAGALVPWLRPKELATDEATSVEVTLHALDWYEAKFGTLDGLLLLQPTSPFRTRETIEDGIQLFRTKGFQAVLGVSKVNGHPMWTFKIIDGYLVPFMETNELAARSQDLPSVFITNGALYLLTPTELRKYRSFTGSKILPLIMNSNEESMDIDTEWDFRLAESIATSRSEK